MASLVGFDACGIEIDEGLARAGQSIADDLDIPVRLIQGSFLPPESDKLVDEAFSYSDDGLSMFIEADDAYSQLEQDVDDFDVIFAFPWPSDEPLVASLFARFASTGALLLTYDQSNGCRLRRK